MTIIILQDQFFSHKNHTLNETTMQKLTHTI